MNGPFSCQIFMSVALHVVHFIKADVDLRVDTCFFVFCGQPSFSPRMSRQAAYEATCEYGMTPPRKSASADLLERRPLPPVPTDEPSPLVSPANKFTPQDSKRFSTVSTSSSASKCSPVHEFHVFAASCPTNIRRDAAEMWNLHISVSLPSHDGL